MGRKYAGVLGALAAVVIAVRGLRLGEAPNATCLTVAIGVGLFGVLGYVIGEIAETTVTDSVRTKLAGEMTERQNSAKSSPV